MKDLTEPFWEEIDLEPGQRPQSLEYSTRDYSQLTRGIVRHLTSRLRVSDMIELVRMNMTMTSEYFAILRALRPSRTILTGETNELEVLLIENNSWIFVDLVALHSLTRAVRLT